MSNWKCSISELVIFVQFYQLYLVIVGILILGPINYTEGLLVLPIDLFIRNDNIAYEIVLQVLKGYATLMWSNYRIQS